LRNLAKRSRAHRKRPAMIAGITVPDGKTGVAGIPVTDSGDDYRVAKRRYRQA
jgi:hypothetical protein